MVYINLMIFSIVIVGLGMCWVKVIKSAIALGDKMSKFEKEEVME